MKKVRLLLVSMLVVLLLASVSYADTYEKGSTGKSVEKIQQQLKKVGYFNGDITGYYGPQTKSAVIAFQKKKGLKPDGVIGQATYKLLFSSKTKPVTAAKKATVTTTAKKASTSSTKMVTAKVVTTNSADDKTLINEGALDWWKDVSHIFARGDIAKVTDIKTGRSFYVERTYGRNHADVEATDAKNSAIIKDIWGGWSWDRRPVTVEIDGKIIAASMTAMPHAGVDNFPANKVVSNRSGGFRRGTNLDTIKHNGMNGHMDIHFLNSRNHYNNKIDPKHQAIIRQAAAYLEKIKDKQDKKTDEK